jgi:hypothetical protein
LSALFHQFSFIAALVFLAAGLTFASAKGAEPPENIAEAVSEAARACKHTKGTPNTDAVLSAKDLNGNGGEDWIADFGKMTCDGGTNPLCGDAGCTIRIYFWDGDKEWDLVFEDFVRSYKFGKAGGKPMLYVTTSGIPCNKPVTETCEYNYRLEKDTVVPVKSAAAESSAAKKKKSEP